MFQKAMKISPPVLPVILAEHQQIFQKYALSSTTGTVVTLIIITKVELDASTCIVPKSVLLNGVRIMKHCVVLTQR